jgi:hypothetical protein
MELSGKSFRRGDAETLSKTKGKTEYVVSGEWRVFPGFARRGSGEGRAEGAELGTLVAGGAC